DASNAARLNRLVSLATERLVPSQPGPQGLPSNDTKTIAKKQYDEFQKAAIEAPTPALIVAGPGSGKTSTLIGRAEYLINELQVPPEHILALTFSRKAAQEMLERFESHPGNEARLTARVNPTIHASASTYGQPGSKEVLEQVLHQEGQHQAPMFTTFPAFCDEI